MKPVLLMSEFSQSLNHESHFLAFSPVTVSVLEALFELLKPYLHSHPSPVDSLIFRTGHSQIGETNRIRRLLSGKRSEWKSDFMS